MLIIKNRVGTRFGSRYPVITEIEGVTARTREHNKGVVDC